MYLLMTSLSWQTAAQPNTPQQAPTRQIPAQQSLGRDSAQVSAVGDCVDAIQAMARTYTIARRPPARAEKTCENGRIQVMVQTERHFGHRIMDPVHVRVLLSVDPSVNIDFGSLSRGTVTFDGQEFDLVSPLALGGGQIPVEIQTQHGRDGRSLIALDLFVQSSVPPSVAPYLVFRLDLRYALGSVGESEGNATPVPDWRVLSSPAIGLTLSPTAVARDEFVVMETRAVRNALPWPTYGLLSAGIFLIFLAPGLWVVRWINRQRPGRKIPPGELAWRTLDRVFSEARRNGFSSAHFKAISASVRRYLVVSSSTHSELRERLYSHPQFKAIMRVLCKCDAVLYRASTLSEEELVELIEDVEAVVPRP